MFQAKHLRFTFTLTNEDGSDAFQGLKLNRFAMQEVAGEFCYMTLRPPEKASYFVGFYAKDLTDKVVLCKLISSCLQDTRDNPWLLFKMCGLQLQSCVKWFVERWWDLTRVVLSYDILCSLYYHEKCVFAISN